MYALSQCRTLSGSGTKSHGILLHASSSSYDSLMHPPPHMALSGSGTKSHGIKVR